jgi:hypothetical protein
MKKGFFLLLTLFCVVSLLVGCGGGGKSSNNPGTGNTITDQLNSSSKSVTALQEVAKKAESAGQSASSGPSASFMASEEEPREEPGGEHGPVWAGPDADGWYSSTQYTNSPVFGDSHVWKVKMKIEGNTTSYKLDDTTTLPDGTTRNGSEETIFTVGANNLVSGTSKYTRYYQFEGIDYTAIASQTFSNFGSDGTGHYETELELKTVTLANPSNKNDLKFKEIFDITLNATKTKLSVNGTITDVSTAYPKTPSQYNQEWDLITPAK